MQKKSDQVAMTTINKRPGRHKIEELLPGHATGTLSRRDADRVEQALAGDCELARRYELVRRELAETTRLNETLSRMRHSFPSRRYFRCRQLPSSPPFHCATGWDISQRRAARLE